jgi:hypothetical protein
MPIDVLLESSCARSFESLKDGHLFGTRWMVESRRHKCTPHSAWRACARAVVSGLLAVPPTSSRKRYIVTQTTAHKDQVKRKRVGVTCRLRGSGFSPSVAAARTCRNHATPREDRTEQETDANTRVARLWEDDLPATTRRTSRGLHPSMGGWSHY